MEVIKHRHTYTNWHCPYFDVDKDFMRETCSRCGKIKGLGWRYVGRHLNGERIVIRYMEKLE